MIVIYVTASLGMFALLRWHRVRTVPAFVAGVSYAYCGAMIGQMVHLGVVQGYSFIPWAMLLMLALSRRLTRVDSDASFFELARVGLPWALGVAALWGLTFLSGEPRAISSIELLTIVVVPCVLILRSSYWLRLLAPAVAYLATLAVGFAWGLGLGLIQLLPGWSFINFSERNSISYAYFGAGSLAARWTRSFHPRSLWRERRLRPARFLRQLQPGRGDRIRRGPGAGGRGGLSYSRELAGLARRDRD